MQLTLGEIASALGSSCRASDRVARGYSIDSRTLSPGELFFAVRGRRTDGHLFVEAAFAAGAVGAVVERAYFASQPPERAPALIPVDDTNQALQVLARAVRLRWGRQVIGITGSTGKTTTKEMTAAILSRRYGVLKSPGNLNNLFGLPLSLLALGPEHEVAVVELAMSAAGEIARLARIAEVDIGVVTNVGPAHLEFFDSVEAIARAKRELIENLNPAGCAVLNHDDARVRRFREVFNGRVVTFGLTEGADFRALDLRPRHGIGTLFRVVGFKLDAEFSLPLPGTYNVENAVAAIAASSLFEVPVRDLQQALASFENLHQRSEILTLPGELLVINDSYNSNPLAMERALEALAGWPDVRRKIVVAGEMLELGRTSPELHYAVGQKCARLGVDWLLAVQGEAQSLLRGALDAGLDPQRGKFFPSAEEAGKFCRELVRPGDLVLLKGSRGVHLETVLKLLQERAGSNHPTVDPRPTSR